MSDRKNYHTIRYGNADGEIKFGHLHYDDELSSVLLRSGKDKKHYITMDSSGDDTRKNGTICRSPGSFQVKAGDKVEEENPAIYLDAVNGDVVIRAPNGRIRMEAINIDIIASGPDNENGIITLDANDKILGRAQTIDMSSKVSTKVFSEKTVECIGNGLLNIYGGFIDCADGGTNRKGSKAKSSNEEKHQGGMI